VGGLFHVDDVTQVEATASLRRERQSRVDELNLDLHVLRHRDLLGNLEAVDGDALRVEYCDALREDVVGVLGVEA
jgi:hypothetical protein